MAGLSKVEKLLCTAFKDARDRVGSTQMEVAHIIGIEQSAVSRLEKGQQRVTMDVLSRFAKAFAVYDFGPVKLNPEDLV